MVSRFEESPVRLRDGRKVTLRAATPDDGVAVSAYCEAVIRESQPFIITMPDEKQFIPEQTAAWIASHRTAAGAIVLIAETNDAEVVAMLECEVPSRRRLMHMGDLDISARETWREVGLGTAMMHRLITWATDHPALVKLALSVLADNHRAIRLYRKCGFVAEGRRIREVQREPGAYVDDILMYRFVKPMVGEDCHGRV